MLNETVHTLSRMIRDLEKQLENMLTMNEALEKDLDKERAKTLDAVKARDALTEQIRDMEQERLSVDDMRVEIHHLEQERARLAETIEEMGRQLSEVTQENIKLERLLERMRVERDDAAEEAQSVEAQFDRAMEIAGELKTGMVALAEERDDLKARLKASESQLRLTEEHRDALKLEVEESRRALDEIRHEVEEACVLSQRFYYQE
jgi:chromosome segregation ATPase